MWYTPAPGLKERYLSGPMVDKLFARSLHVALSVQVVTKEGIQAVGPARTSRRTGQVSALGMQLGAIPVAGVYDRPHRTKALGPVVTLVT